MPGWLNWHHGAPEQGAAAEHSLELAATGAAQQTCGTKYGKSVFEYICDSIRDNTEKKKSLSLPIGMFPFEPVPQKVISPLTSASQMKSLPQLSATKFISSLLNKDRVGWLFFFFSHLKRQSRDFICNR